MGRRIWLAFMQAGSAAPAMLSLCPAASRRSRTRRRRDCAYPAVRRDAGTTGPRASFRPGDRAAGSSSTPARHDPDPPRSTRSRAPPARKPATPPVRRARRAQGIWRVRVRQSLAVPARKPREAPQASASRAASSRIDATSGAAACSATDASAWTRYHASGQPRAACNASLVLVGASCPARMRPLTDAREGEGVWGCRGGEDIIPLRRRGRESGSLGLVADSLAGSFTRVVKSRI